MLGLIVVALSTASCGGDDPTTTVEPPDPTLKVTPTFSAPQGDMTRPPPHKPNFEPDFNNLTPRPGVAVVTDAQRDAADVFPDRIEFPATLTSVKDLQPGQIITAAGGQGTGRNPMGFARRIAKVELVGGKYVVSTLHVAISDLIEGDFRTTFTPDNSQPVDLKKLDLQWAADNLYDNDASMILTRVLLTADSPPGQQPAGLLGFLEDVGGAIGGFFEDKAIGTWDKIKQAGADFYKFVTTGTFEGGFTYNPVLGFKLDSDEQLWPSVPSLTPMPLFSKTVATASGTGVKIGLDGKLSYRAGAYLEPGVQVIGRFSVVEEPKLGINLDSYAEVGVKFDMDVAATVTSASGNDLGGFKSLVDLNKKQSKAAGAVKTLVKKTLMSGDALAGAPYKFVLFITKPQVKWIQAGPVPVAIVMTMQINLECDFGVQADIKAHADFTQNASFKFGAELTPSSGGRVTQQPLFQFQRKHEYGFDRIAGNLSAKCGVVPRVNVLLYDAAGIYAGIWGGIHARGAYRDDCGSVGGATDMSPDAVLDGSLAARVAVVVGGILQPPGTSTLPDDKRMGMNSDVGALRKEVYSKEWPLYSATWRKAGAGLGWCPATCPNGKKDSEETDVDCGGNCARKCTLGQQCKVNSECETGVCNHKTGVGICSYDSCGDLVQDGTETDVDCGGQASCGRCATGKSCRSGLDCQSGYCAGPKAATPLVCVDSHCTNKVKDGDEGGLDCGGAECPKCATGALASSADDCASGFFNGSICVANGCGNRKQDGDESDVDCGGSCPNRCQSPQRCNSSADCGNGGTCRDVRHANKGTVKICVARDGALCSDYIPTPFKNWYGDTFYKNEPVPDTNETCASGVCKNGSLGGGYIGQCAAPTCTDGIKNGDEGDIDCGAGCPEKCLCGQRCSKGLDCDALCGGCNSGFCGGGANRCSNNWWDSSSETDVDCGGQCAVKCKLYRRCKVDADCELKYCGGSGYCYPPANLVGAWPLHGNDQNALAPQKAPGVIYPSASYQGVYTGDTHWGTTLYSATFGGPSGSLPATTLGNAFTIAAWIKPRTDIVTSARNAIMASAPAGNVFEPGFIWFINSQGSGDLSLHFQSGDGATGADYATGANAIKVGVWQHVAVTVDRATKTVSFFVDGLLVNGASGALNEAFTDGLPLSIGAAAIFPEFPLTAFMEELRIYNKALAPLEILALKNQT